MTHVSSGKSVANAKDDIGDATPRKLWVEPCAWILFPAVVAWQHYRLCQDRRRSVGRKWGCDYFEGPLSPGSGLRLSGPGIAQRMPRPSTELCDLCQYGTSHSQWRSGVCLLPCEKTNSGSQRPPHWRLAAPSPLSVSGIENRERVQRSAPVTN